MEVAIVMEMRQSCSQRAQTTSTPHSCITPSLCRNLVLYSIKAAACTHQLIPADLITRAGMDLKTNKTTKQI